METTWITDFRENTTYRIDESTRMIEIAYSKVNEEHIWQRFNSNSNSLGNLILHLCGNMTQYVIASVGEEVDTRDRDTEFATRDGFTKAELIDKLKSTVERVKQTILNATENQLLKKRDVQGFNFSGMGCIIHAVEHYSYHTGQIAFRAKQLVDEQLGFYDGMDLNTLNNDN